MENEHKNNDENFHDIHEDKQETATFKPNVMLKGPVTLLKEAFADYQKNILYYLGIILLALVGSGVVTGLLIAGLAMFVAGSSFTVLNIILTIMAVFAAIAGLFWAQTTLLYAVTQGGMKKGILSAYKKALPLLLGYIWISVLVGAVTLGGFYLMIIPGIIFSVWFSFAPYILLTENIRGLNALSKSREYVRDYWWPVFGRILILVLLSVGAQIIIGIVFGILGAGAGNSLESFQGVASMVISFLLAPFFMVYIYQLFKNLREVKGEVPEQATTKQKVLYIGAGMVAILLPVTLVALVGAWLVFGAMSAGAA